MAKLIDNIQERVRSTTSAAALLAVKIIVAAFLGLTFALIGDEVFKYGWFSFIFVLVTIAAVVLRLSRAWSWPQILIFTLICVLIGLSLRMYILIAP